jgi:two-component system OmpR family sensor kinase
MLKASVRFRLTLWNSVILALLLGAFASASLILLEDVLNARTEDEVKESAQAIAQTIRTERARAHSRGEDPRPEVARDALQRLRAGGLDVYIVDEASRVVTASRSNARHNAHESTTSVVTAPLPSASGGPDTLNLPAHVRALLDRSPQEATGSTGPQVLEILVDGLPYRAAVERVAQGSNADEPALAVAVLRSSIDDIEVRQTYRNTLLFAIPLALIFSILCGYAIARRSLAPVEAMGEQAERISAANLDERLPVANEHDELGRLATVVNDLLERVHGAFLQQRQFVADASHELRTPIAIVRGEADVTLQRNTRDESEYREALAIISEESVRLTRIVDDLFLLARSDAGAPVAQFATLDLREVVLGALKSVRTIADDHGIALQQSVPDEAFCIYGDAPLLRRLMLNLLDNALKYTPRGGNVGVIIEPHDSTVSIVVYDSGPGISEALRSRVFDRFVRAGPDERPAHFHDTPRAAHGAGLGLSIAAAIATAHHGTLSLDDNTHGARFRVVLPLKATA